MRPNRFAIVSAVCLSLAAVGSEAALLPWSASLDGIQVPTTSAGTGTASGFYDTATHVLSWNVTVDGLRGFASLAHFHGPAAPGANAGVRVELPSLDLGSLAGSTSGSFTGSYDLDDPSAIPSYPGLATLESELLSGLWYLNVHTRPFPSGEIRGQVSVVPIPAAAWLLGPALVGLLGLGRRRFMRGS